MPFALRSLLAAGALALAAAGPLAAQVRADSVTVPRELLHVLLDLDDAPGRPLGLVVGRLPDAIPATLLPEGARVLGGVRTAFGGGQFRARSAVLVHPAAPAEAAEATRAHFERAGWRPAGPLRADGGFVPAVVTRPLWLCRDSTAATVMLLPRAAGGSYVRVTLNESRQNGCGALAMRSSSSVFERAPMPTLAAPVGARSFGGSGGGGMDSRESSDRLEVALSPADLVRHYAPQLERQGWTLGEELRGEHAASRVASLVDSAGVAWEGLLTAQSLRTPANERHVSFRLLRATTRR